MRSSATIFLVRSGRTRRNEIPVENPAGESLIDEGVGEILSASRALSRTEEIIEAVYTSNSKRASIESAGLIIKSVLPHLQIRQMNAEFVVDPPKSPDHNPYIEKILFNAEKERPDIILRFKKELDENNIKTTILVDDGELIQKILISSGFISRVDNFKIKHGSIFKCIVTEPLVSVTKILN